MCIHHCCRLMNCGDVATDLVPMMPPECSQGKQDRRSGCDMESSARLSTSRFQSATKEPEPRLPVLDNGAPSLLTSPPDWQLWFIWCRLFCWFICLDWCWRTDTLLHHLWTDVNCTDTKHSKHLFLFLCHSSTGKTLVSWCGKKGWGTWGLLSLLLMFSCSRLLFLFWKHQRWELSRLRVPNICPSLQH